MHAHASSLNGTAVGRHKVRMWHLPWAPSQTSPTSAQAASPNPAGHRPCCHLSAAINDTPAAAAEPRLQRTCLMRGGWRSRARPSCLMVTRSQRRPPPAHAQPARAKGVLLRDTASLPSALQQPWLGHGRGHGKGGRVGGKPASWHVRCSCRQWMGHQKGFGERGRQARKCCAP